VDGSIPVGVEISHAIQRLDQPLFVVDSEGQPVVATGGEASVGENGDGAALFGCISPCPIESLGDAGFLADYGVRYPYVAGSMANGIASVELVEAMARRGMLAFFGSAGLPIEKVEAAVLSLKESLGDAPHGFNLIHSPNESALELAIVDLYLRHGVRIVEASAFLRLTLPLVKYRLHGIHRGPNGEVVAPNRIVAKVSRVEIATRFLAPPPEKLIGKLLESGDITLEQAELAKEIPLAQDITAEADSGGHTDNRPAIALLPTLCALRDRMAEEYGYSVPLRVGLGGGISTPASAAAAFAMGAAYVMTGTINQACVESGSSDLARGMLADAGQADTAMAPAADMFEMGVEVQVLKRGTMFSMRASKLYELYRACQCIEDIPTAEREKLEKTIFRAPLEEVWKQTRAFFEKRDPRQIEKAEADPRHKMALIFRSYLGQASGWANRGVEDRKMDFQLWCGPAMGAFNEWVKGSCLEPTANRRVAGVALNLLFGAAALTRVQALRRLGVALPPDAMRVRPMPDNEISEAVADLTGAAARSTVT
jgi:PfaD family protein